MLVSNVPGVTINLTGQWADQILFRIFIVICEAHTGSP